jgi:hypothetical protein
LAKLTKETQVQEEISRSEEKAYTEKRIRSESQKKQRDEIEAKGRRQSFQRKLQSERDVDAYENAKSLKHSQHSQEREQAIQEHKFKSLERKTLSKIRRDKIWQQKRNAQKLGKIRKEELIEKYKDVLHSKKIARSLD